jgi:hypothetical protein
MKQRFGRVAAVLVLVAAAAASAQQAVTRSRAASASEQRVAAIATASARADAALAELAAAERAYVAPGQGLDFWAGKVDEALASARASLTDLQAPSAISRLDDFIAMDRRARDYMGNGQRAMAADLIFADGYEILATARSEAAAAASLATTPLLAAASRDRQLHLASIAGLGACALIAALLLLKTPRVAPLVTAIEPAAPVTPVQEPVAETDDAIGAALDASLDGLKTAAVDVPASATVDLASAAEVCVDLARLLDANDLQNVLSRIATVLNARGVIVWVADASGTGLSPAITHGYPASLLARLGPLPLSDDNPTTAAWHSGSTQVVGGALAVPMLTSDGCTGVLALEVRDGGERASDVQSLARIVAAQLATTVSGATPVPGRAAEA